MQTSIRQLAYGLVLIVVASGCNGIRQAYVLVDPNDAIEVVQHYLDDQKSGLGNSAKYGQAGNFYNLSEYRVVGTGYNWVGRQAVFVRVKAGNKGGGNPVWEDYTVTIKAVNGAPQISDVAEKMLSEKPSVSF